MSPVRINARLAFAAHHDGSHLARRTRQRFSHDLNCWEKFTGNPEVSRISTETFGAFRAACTTGARTTESVIDAVRAILNSCPRDVLAAVPGAGKRLRRRKPEPKIPPMANLNAMLRCCGAATYPRRKAEPCWRGFLASAIFTGFRHDDLLTFPREAVSAERIAWNAEKTEKTHALPMHPVYWRVLQDVPDFGPRLFPFGQKCVRWQLGRIAKAAGVPTIGPQALRRLSATWWESAYPGAGPLILGHGIKGATSFYLSVPVMLAAASSRLAIPDALLTEEERENGGMSDDVVLSAFRRLGKTEREVALRMVRGLASATGT